MLCASRTKVRLASPDAVSDDGKSAFLSALDLFFASSPRITEKDFSDGHTNVPIDITVHFSDFTPYDQAEFEGNLLEGPQYTRPANFRGIKVPDVLLSGNHKTIEIWRKSKAMAKTKKVRPDLLQNQGD